MKSVLGFVALLIAISMSERTQAAPWIFYDPASGGLWLKNDTGANIVTFTVNSAGSHLKTDANLFASAPGAIVDTVDLPLSFTYLNFPPTNNYAGLFIGNVVAPGTPPSDLSGHYRVSPTGQGFPIPGPVELLPEPASGLLLASGMLAFAAKVRRSSGRRQGGRPCSTSSSA